LAVVTGGKGGTMRPSHFPTLSWLLLGVLIAVPLPSGANDCRSDGTADPRIVRIGDEAIDRWPGFAALRMVKGNVERYFCGGTAIDRQWVVTAAHCVFGLTKDSATGQVQDLDGWALELVLGVDNLEFVSAKDRYLPETILLHEKYELVRSAGSILKGGGNVIGILNDIALIQLKQPWEGPVASIGTVAPDSMLLRVAGFGLPGPDTRTQQYVRKSDGVTYHCGSQQMKVATLPQSSIPRCRAAYNNTTYINAQHICAGAIWKGEDSCRGDSGGPLVKLEFATGCPFLVGLVSWGGRCGYPKEYGVYTRVADFAEWIEQKTKLQLKVADAKDLPITALQQGLLQQLEGALSPVAAKLEIFLPNQGRVQVGKLFRISVDSPVNGRLILIDIKPDGQISQILPNGFSKGAVSVSSAEVVRIPSRATHGFDAFQAEETLGRGRVIGIVVPSGFAYEHFLRGSESLGDAKKKAPLIDFKDRTGAAYLTHLVDQIQRALADKTTGAAGRSRMWAFGAADYEHIN
jgi:secreted trypsin-like serine protease